jgi:hypothetical protein
LKAWKSQIQAHVERWSIKLASAGRPWWPKFVYHSTDLANVVSILETGRLYCRNEAVRLGLMQNDNASPEVIAGTLAAHQNYVRMYFRPQTPTHYHSEGFRPPGERKLGAHCPMPFFCCFDAVETLAVDDTEFSDGNMGSGRVRHGNSEAFFASIPFDLVFHSHWVAPEERDRVVFHRNAEVLIPRSMEVRPLLRMIACRSPAEMQTLQHRLSFSASMRWWKLIRLGFEGMFMRQATYVETVAWVGDVVTFNFSPNSRCTTPHEAEFLCRELGRAWHWTGQHHPQSPRLQLRVESAQGPSVTALKLDGCVAFEAASHTTLPF